MGKNVLEILRSQNIESTADELKEFLSVRSVMVTKKTSFREKITLRLHSALHIQHQGVLWAKMGA